MIFFCGRPLKNFQRSDRDKDLNFPCKLKISIEKILKAFLHPPPPLEKEISIKIVELRVSKIVLLSIPKVKL
jgi:hypothetical protein